ncbi:MAG: hypothetical protein M1457_05520, partial [bacterium]|nr:hypothetical protein [bacterium]
WFARRKIRASVAWNGGALPPCGQPMEKGGARAVRKGFPVGENASPFFATAPVNHAYNVDMAQFAYVKNNSSGGLTNKRKPV